MFRFFLLFSIVVIIISYVNIDPMKSSFFLVFSLLFRVPLVSFGSFVWYSYFICLLFLRGVFVILVYFSSLSKFGFNKNYFSLVCFFLTFLLLFGFNYINFGLGLNFFYYYIYLFLFMFVLIMLLFFINFRSYFLNFSGALRKI